MPVETIEATQLNQTNGCGGEEDSQPLSRSCGVRMDHFTERPCTDLFAEQVARNPEKLAIICEDGKLTYAQLNARANQLAHHLQSRGVGPESLVGICVERSLDMAIGILGILKSGAAYLPLDPDYPMERLAWMIKDSRLALVVTKASFTDQLPIEASRCVLLDGGQSAISRQSAANPIDGPKANSLAYVIYTSGSTGQPKGVMIAHRSLANYLLALQHELHVSVDDVYLHLASIAFSSSRRQLLLPLLHGATVVIATAGARKDPLALFETIKSEGVTIMDAVPSFWRNCTAALSDIDVELRRRLLDNRLRLMLSASEPLLSDVPRVWTTEFRHPARHVHMFGQTETSGIVCLHRIEAGEENDRGAIPIGRPIANTEIYILDEQLQPAAAGEAGELYIGGAGVGRGYLNLPDLTAEKFIAHPFNSKENARLYRTGDWARFRADGQIEFLGRHDNQVKLRGFRIELGEVEAVLARHPAIREGAVLAREERSGNKRLVAYFVPRATAPSVSELRDFLAAHLPDYVVPSAFVQMPALPLTPNGKIDRRALPEPDESRPELAINYEAPRTPSESRLAEIWSEVLRLKPVGIRDNFFELGGHSLLATQIVSRARREFKTELPLRALFEAPTVAEMAERIEATSVTDYHLTIPKLSAGEQHRDRGPLSFAQQRLWFLDQLQPGSASYNIRRAFRVTGALDVEKFQRAIDAIVARHEILRTRIVSNEGRPMQVIAPFMQAAVEVTDISSLPAAEREIEALVLAKAEGQRAFDLATGPLFRIKLIKLSDDAHLLLLSVHHSIGDGWSIGLLLGELANLYHAYSAGVNADLPPLQIQYADFAVWQRQWLQGDVLERKLVYWRAQLEDLPASLDLPADYSRPLVQSFRGAQESLVLPQALSNAIKTLSQQEGVTLFMTLLAAFQTLLFRHSGQDDIVVGSPIAGRTMIETERLVGSFVNTLVLRGDLSGDPSFRELLRRIREVALGAYTHQDVPFEKLVEDLHPDRSPDRSPLFQVMFALQNTPVAELPMNGLKLTPLKLGSTTAKFDLTLDITEEADGLHASLEYNTDLFAPETINRLLAHFEVLLGGVVADPSQRITALPLLTEAERKQLLFDWNAGAAEFPADACVQKLFEAWAEKNPQAIAAVFGDERITYGELNRRANQLAHYLRKQGVGPEVLVGISVERSLEMLVAIIGVLKAGGAYLPLDPMYPRDRIEFMLEDSGVALVLTQRRLVDQLPNNTAKLICLDSDWNAIAAESEENPLTESTPEDLAYVIYTSGSTGKSKGVMVTRASLANAYLAWEKAYGLQSIRSHLQMASFSFDVFTGDLVRALCSGAKLVLCPQELLLSPKELYGLMRKEEIEAAEFVPVVLRPLIQHLDETNQSLDFMKLVIAGSDTWYSDEYRRLLRFCGPRTRLINSYGLTEATIDSTYFESDGLDLETGALVPIGRPFANTRIYILDEQLQPSPVGVAGELFIGGAGVARGYLKRPELTMEKFIADPFSNGKQARLYRTGDWARYRADGQIEFLGRRDNQVKVRGFRIELGEVEAVLARHPAIKESVVVAREERTGTRRLVAYFVPRDEAPTVSEMRSLVSAQLPEYMVPSTFVELAAMPLTANGKINRRALPEPDDARPDLASGYEAPRTPIELKLAEIWSEVLQVESVGANDSFFELGGHSLLATQVVSRVRRAFEIELPLRSLFETPTVARLAETICQLELDAAEDEELRALLAELEHLTDEDAQHRFLEESRMIA
jgi:amino acid adenylation domain-containing protein